MQQETSTVPKNKKLAFFLPNTFTALNMGCGFVSILFSLQAEFYKACMILILGAIFDTVDGRVARITATQSAFGEQFDSMSDLISFGMAPAIMVHQKFLLEMGRVGIVVSFIFLLCGALRLARFNANIEKIPSSFFQGLPIPSGALALVGLVLLSLDFSQVNYLTWGICLYVLFYGVLMVSNIPFNSFKDSYFVKKHKKVVLFTMFLLAALTFIHEQIMIFAVITAYVLGSLIYLSTHKDMLSNVFLWKEEPETREEDHESDPQK